MTAEWKIPSSIDEAEERKRIVIGEIEEIMAQLGPVEKTEQDTDYLTWRKKAKWALANRLQELRLIKSWIRSNVKEAV